MIFNIRRWSRQTRYFIIRFLALLMYISLAFIALHRYLSNKNFYIFSVCFIFSGIPLIIYYFWWEFIGSIDIPNDRDLNIQI